MRRLDPSFCKPSQATGLRFAYTTTGGTDLLAGLVVGELNFTQITS